MTYDLVRIVLIGLAAAQITALLVDERGPFAILRWFRLLTGIRYREMPESRQELLGVDNLEDNEPYALGELGRLFICANCTGTWIAGLLFLGVFFNLISMDLIAGLAAIKICVWAATH